MPGKRIKDLTALSGAGSANNDDVVIFDTNADITKRISRSQLAEGMIGDLPFLYFHGVRTTDPTQRFNGDSLVIGDGYLRSSDMIFRYYTSSGWQNYEQISIAAAQAWAEGTLPGGAGTYSSKEWSETSEAWADGTLPGGAGTYSSREWSDTSEAWAVNPEDTAVEPSKYSALHYAAKAQGYANVAGAAAGFFDRENAIAVTTDTTLTYTAGQPGTVAAGDIIRTRAEGFAYEVAASGATDQHVTTTGGVKLYMAGTKYYFTQLLTNAENATTRGAKFVKLMQAAHDDSKVAVVDGGVGTVYQLNGTFVTLTDRDISVEFDGAQIELSSIMGFYGPQLTTTATLTADANWKTNRISVSSVAGISIGDSIRLGSAAQPSTSYSYTKQSMATVVNIIGNDIVLSHRLSFQFSVAETSILTWAKRSVRIKNLNVKTVTGGRFDLGALQDCVVDGCNIMSTGKTGGDPLFIQLNVMTTLKDVRVHDARYGINISSGSRDTYITNIHGWNCRHPIDANVFAHGVYVKNFLFEDTQGSIECHPAFEVHYDTGVFDSGYGLRAIGASLKNARCSEASVLDPSTTLTAWGIRAGYEYLREDQIHTIENVDMPFVYLSTDGSSSYFRNVKYYQHSGDSGTDSGLPGTRYVHMDSRCRSTLGIGASRRYVKRQLEPVEQVSVKSFLDAGAAKTVTNITQANPAVVTVVAHGLSTGNSVLIEGVTGMTEINGLFSDIVVTGLDTFSLNWINSTGYTAYASGGTAKAGVAAYLVDVQSAANGTLVGNSNTHFTTRPNEGYGTTNSLDITKIPNRFRIGLNPLGADNDYMFPYWQGEIIIRIGGFFDGGVAAMLPLEVKYGSAVFGPQSYLLKPGVETLTFANTIYSAVNGDEGVQFDFVAGGFVNNQIRRLDIEVRGSTQALIQF